MRNIHKGYGTENLKPTDFDSSLKNIQIAAAAVSATRVPFRSSQVNESYELLQKRKNHGSKADLKVNQSDNKISFRMSRISGTRNPNSPSLTQSTINK